MNVISKAAMAVVPLALVVAGAGNVPAAQAAPAHHHHPVEVTVTKKGDQFFDSYQQEGTDGGKVIVNRKADTVTLKNGEHGFSQVTYKFRVQKGAHDFYYSFDLFSDTPGGLVTTSAVDTKPWKQHHKWYFRTTAWLEGQGEVTIEKALVTYTVDKECE